MSEKEKIESLKYLVKRLRKMAGEMEKTVEKERQRKKSKIEWMNEYKTYDDAQEAYGMGTITRAEYDAVLDALDSGEAYVESETPKSAALKELKSYIAAIANDIALYEEYDSSQEN